MKALSHVAILVAVLCGLPDTVRAHSFNVALVIALAEPSAAAGREVRDGFLLATRERDGHPDEHSDGHLGGLDVYLHPVDLATESLAGVRAVLDRAKIDIVAVVGSAAAAADIRPLIDESRTLLMAPGRLRTPLPEDFARAFNAAFGYPPGEAAAHGYNAARRIDAAVRPLDGVADRATLRQALDTSRDGIDW